MIRNIREEKKDGQRYIKRKESVAVLTSDKFGFKSKGIKQEKEEHCK